MAASNGKSSAATDVAKSEIVVTRVFDAPRELVFKAWTEPERLMRWWAPKGLTTPFCKVDLRPGGAFHYCMRSAEGKEIWGIGVYREIAEPERIVYTDSFADAEGNPVPPAHYGMSAGHPSETLVTVTFAEHEGKTKLTLRHSIPDSVEEREGTAQGWTEMLDRLAADVGGDAAREIVATRVFDAPRELVFRMWTDPKHVAQWWGPKGFTNTIYEMDVRPGGVWQFVMHGPDGVDYKNKIVYVQIVRPERLVYDHVSGPQFHVTTTFEDEGGKTKVSVRMLFESAALRDKVAEEFGAVEGLTQTLGRLEEELARLRVKAWTNSTSTWRAPRKEQ